jgi:D-alanine-D-alanine ligase
MAKKNKILVLHNGRPSSGPEAEPLERDHMSALAEALASRGFDVSVVDAEDDTARISQAVTVQQPDLVFNLVTHFRGDTLQQPNLASLLELQGLPYTGSDPLCLSTCQDRIRTHLLLGDAEIPVPPYVVVRDINGIPDTAGLGFPLVVSHAFDDIYDEPSTRSLVRSRGELEERVRELAAGAELPLLVERYLAGRRIQAVVLGNRALEVLPLTERLLDGSGVLGAAQVAQLGPSEADVIRGLARRAFRVMDCRDCAQIDFALDTDDEPYALDVRPVFDTFPGSPFVAGTRASALGFEGAVALLADIGLERAGEAVEAAPDLPRLPPPPDPEPEPEPELEQPPEPRAARKPRLQAPPRKPASRGRPRQRLQTVPGIPLADAVPVDSAPAKKKKKPAKKKAAVKKTKKSPSKKKPK